MSCASSWNTVEVVRPQPGQAMTMRREERKAHGLQHLLRDVDFTRAVAAGLGVSEMRIVSPMPSCSRIAERRGRRDDPLRAHARFGQAEMESIVTARRQHTVNRDQVLHSRDLGRDDDLIAPSPISSARACRAGRLHHGFMHHRARFERRVRLGVLVHQRGQQCLVERSPS